MRGSRLSGPSAFMVNETLTLASAPMRKPCPAPQCTLPRPGPDAPAQRFHHHPRIDFENLPGAVDLNHVDRTEADADGVRGLDRERDAGLARIRLAPAGPAARRNRDYAASSAADAGPAAECASSAALSRSPTMPGSTRRTLLRPASRQAPTPAANACRRRRPKAGSCHRRRAGARSSTTTRTSSSISR